MLTILAILGGFILGVVVTGAVILGAIQQSIGRSFGW